DRIIFIAPSLMKTKNQWILGRIKNKVSLVPFGVDLNGTLSNRTAEMQNLGLTNDKFLIGTTASIVPQKGLHLLVEAVAELVRRGIKLQCLIIGGTPGFGQEYELDLKRRVGKLKLEQQVHFLGWRQDAAGLIGILDVYVLPSLSEGLSRSTVEAMWMERPVVVTDTGAMGDLVDDEVGRLVPKNDVGALVDAVEFFYRNPEVARTCGKAGSDRVRREHSISNHVNKMEGVFLSLIK
ncbi:MAG: glycosyltransferase family 4 protein, partial [Verrucomicrobia bacterium]|nr:glycosyltransferase family 4 protein [Verrucomicrobiota bacterium]